METRTPADHPGENFFRHLDERARDKPACRAISDLKRRHKYDLGPFWTLVDEVADEIDLLHEAALDVAAACERLAARNADGAAELRTVASKLRELVQRTLAR